MSSKLPFLKFYPAQYVNDTRLLSLATKGGWVDVICALHSSATRGVLTLPIEAWARVMGTDVAQARQVFDELSKYSISQISIDGNGDVTVSSRRMEREGITKVQTRRRVQNHRNKQKDEPELFGQEGEACNAPGNAQVTDRSIEDRILEDKHAPGPRPRDPLFDALCVASGEGRPEGVTPKKARQIGVALAEIKKATPGVTPEEITRRAGNYKAHFRDATISAMAVAMHWARLAQGTQTAGQTVRLGQNLTS